MSISNDYLDLDSVASKELTEPLFRMVDENDMIVAAFSVHVFFQTQQNTWFWQEKSIKSDSVSREVQLFEEIMTARQKQPPVEPLIHILRTFSPIISLAEPEKELSLISETCNFIREDIKTSDEILLAFVTASLGSTESEILQKLNSISREQFLDLWTTTIKMIQNSSDLELFKQIQFLFSNLVTVVKMTHNLDIETPAEIKKKEILKISNCYREAIKEVCNRSEPKELTRILVVVALVNRHNLNELTTGYYDVSNQKPGKWTWMK